MPHHEVVRMTGAELIIFSSAFFILNCVLTYLYVALENKYVYFQKRWDTSDIVLFGMVALVSTIPYVGAGMSGVVMMFAVPEIMSHWRPK